MTKFFEGLRIVNEKLKEEILIMREKRAKRLAVWEAKREKKLSQIAAKETDTEIKDISADIQQVKEIAPQQQSPKKEVTTKPPSLDITNMNETPQAKTIAKRYSGVWPGSLRGWGPITMRIDSDL